MIILLVSAAFAQDAFSGGDTPALNAQLFNPSIDARSTLWTNDSLLAPDAYTSARGVLHYANAPLVYEDTDGNITELVSGLWQLDAMVAHTRGPLRLGLDVPIYLRGNGSSGGESGLGDIAADFKLSGIDRRERVVGLAVDYRLTLPTSTVDAALGGDTIGWELGLIVDKELGDKTLVAANVGTRGVPNVELENFEYGDQFFWRLGVGHQLNDATGVSVDLVQHRSYGAGDSAGRPTEALVGAHRRVGDLVLRGGVGTGLSPGIGAAKYRLLFSFAWEPPHDQDSDGDGLLDSIDECDAEPEDMDGVADGDGCPEPTRLLVHVVDREGAPLDGGAWTLGDAGADGGQAIELYDGAYIVSATAPDRIGASLQVHVSGEEVVATLKLVPIPGTLRVAAVDEAGDAVDKVTWGALGTNTRGKPGGEAFELPPGEYTIVVNAPGYKPKKETVVVTKETEKVVHLTMVPSKAEVTAEKIDIKESVFFETGKDVIKSESFDLLNDVSDLLDAHPEITKLRIEGHTDDRGNDASNQDLSDRRAASVMEYMISRGIDPSRLESVGYGETKPIESNKTKAGRAQNRRVDFFVAARSDDQTG